MFKITNEKSVLQYFYSTLTLMSVAIALAWPRIAVGQPVPNDAGGNGSGGKCTRITQDCRPRTFGQRWCEDRISINPTNSEMADSGSPTAPGPVGGGGPVIWENSGGFGGV